MSWAENPQLYSLIERLSQKIELKMPKVMVAEIPLPNALTYQWEQGSGDLNAPQYH